MPSIPRVAVKFLIAYDICAPRRLRRVAKRLEKAAVRVQKSVFVLDGSWEDLEHVTADLAALIDVAEDRIQAWPIRDTPAVNGWEAGDTLPGHVKAVVLCPDGVLYLENGL